MKRKRLDAYLLVESAIVNCYHTQNTAIDIIFYLQIN